MAIMKRLLLGLLFFLILHTTKAQNEGIAKHDAEHRLRTDLGLKDNVNNFSHIIPPHTKSSPFTVSIGAAPILLVDLDAKTQTLTLECWIKLHWNDSRLTWDKDSYGGLNLIRVPDHQIWQPDIKIYNSARSSEMDYRNDVYALVYWDGTVVWVPPATLHTICPVDLKYYPYDVQTCSVKLGSWTHSGDHIDIVNGFVDTSDMWREGGEWEVVSTTGRRNVKMYPCCEEAYPDVTFDFIIRRRSPLYKLTILCPIIAAIFLALASFWLPPHAYERLTINCVSLLILVLTLLHLAETIPSTGVHSPLIVCFCGYVTVLVAVMTIVSITFLSILRGQRDRPVPHWMQRVLNSWAARVFCISSPTTFEPFSNTMDRARLELDPEEPHQMNMEVKQQQNNYHWFRFFQLIDHITFCIFFLITIIMLLVSST